jgi:hypothetical protein
MKTTIFLVLAAALSAPGLWAQAEKPAQQKDQPAQAIRVFTVKPGNLDRVWGAVRMIAGQNYVTSDPETGTLVVRTNQDLMPAIEQVVKQLDTTAVSSKNVELTFYILEGSRDPMPNSGALPAELQSTVNQLKTVFAFQSFRLLDTAVIRGRDGRDLTVAGQLPIVGTGQYQLRLRPSLPVDAKPPVIRIDRLHYYNAGAGSSSVSFEAEVDIREGQKVVIGKAGIGTNQNALILVATGKIVE